MSQLHRPEQDLCLLENLLNHKFFPQKKGSLGLQEKLGFRRDKRYKKIKSPLSPNLLETVIGFPVDEYGIILVVYSVGPTGMLMNGIGPLPKLKDGFKKKDEFW